MTTINIDFFKEIDSKEKAYWLGFIFADGTIKNKYCFRLNLKYEEKFWIEKFVDMINGNKDSITQTKDYIYEHTIATSQAHFNVYSKQFVDNLNSHGVVKNKSKIIRFPKLQSYELELAFILGYFDGDGSVNQYGGNICSGSYKFLEDIKTILKLNNNIHNTQTCYRINITKDKLFELYSNYQDSLPRKRIDTSNYSFDDNGKVIHKIINKNSKLSSLSKEILEYELKIYTIQEIAIKYNVTPMSIYRYKKKINV